jgi:nucleotide-binding universal stress UspA family protein
MQAILVPLDGSTLAEQALPFAQLLAPLLDARVHLLRVIAHSDVHRLIAADDVLLIDDPRPTPVERERNAASLLYDEASEYLTSAAQRLRAAGLTVETTVGFGHPAEYIIDTAATGECVLILMATHGYSGLRRWALGSVTDRVVGASSVPVLVIRSANEPMVRTALRRILVPLDGSEPARRALPLALKLAAGAQAELLLLHAVEPPLLSFSASEVGQFGLILDTLTRTAAQDLADLAGSLHAEHAQPIIPLAVTGIPAEVIVDEAVTRECDLIVMATHGRTARRRWALGNVALKVLHSAETPLLLVPSAAQAA